MDGSAVRNTDPIKQMREQLRPYKNPLANHKVWRCLQGHTKRIIPGQNIFRRQPRREAAPPRWESPKKASPEPGAAAAASDGPEATSRRRAAGRNPGRGWAVRYFVSIHLSNVLPCPVPKPPIPATATPPSNTT